MLQFGKNKALVPVGMPMLWNPPLWVKPLIALWPLGNPRSPPPWGTTPVYSSLLFTSVYCSKAAPVPLRRKLWAPVLADSPLLPQGLPRPLWVWPATKMGPDTPEGCLQEGDAHVRRQEQVQANLISLLSSKFSRLSSSSLCISEIHRECRDEEKPWTCHPCTAASL